MRKFTRKEGSAGSSAYDYAYSLWLPITGHVQTVSKRLRRYRMACLDFNRYSRPEISCTTRRGSDIPENIAQDLVRSPKYYPGDELLAANSANVTLIKTLAADSTDFYRALANGNGARRRPEK